MTLCNLHDFMGVLDFVITLTKSNMIYNMVNVILKKKKNFQLVRKYCSKNKYCPNKIPH